MTRVFLVLTICWSVCIGFSGLLKAEEEGVISAVENAKESLLKADIKVGSGVSDREITGEAEIFGLDTADKVYCWSKIMGAGEPVKIKHKWFFGEKLISEIELDINYPSHRTWSYKTLAPEFKGAWKVEVVDANDYLLGFKTFSVE